MPAPGEASASHSRNVGAAAANNDWILFLDSDVIAPADLLASFFSEPIGERVGAMTGDIAGIPDTSTLAARYGTARNFLGQRSHVNNPFRPRASSANLLVRRAAFEQVGGYTEGIWAGEDTDFTWRLQDAGLDARIQRARRGPARLPRLAACARQAVARLRGRRAAGCRSATRTSSPTLGSTAASAVLLKRVGIGPGVAFRADGRSSEPSTAADTLGAAPVPGVECYLASRSRSGCACPTR